MRRGIEDCGYAVCAGENAELFSSSGEYLKCRFSFLAIAFLVRISVQTQQRDGRCRASCRGWRVLERLAPGAQCTEQSLFALRGVEEPATDGIEKPVGHAVADAAR